MISAFGRESICNKGRLEIEGHLQIDAAIGGGRRKRPGDKGIGFAKEGRTEIAYGIRDVDVVEDVAGVDAEREIVAAV